MHNCSLTSPGVYISITGHFKEYINVAWRLQEYVKRGLAFSGVDIVVQYLQKNINVVWHLQK
jgi:hypothetical protein